MATVQVGIVNRALRLIKAGATPDSTESADILVACNAMLDSWNLDPNLAYARRDESLPLSATVASYTIGSNGSPSLNTTRPVKIESAWIESGGISYEVVEMTDQQYAGLQDKTSAGDWPNRFLYRPSYPNGTVIVYPVPNASRTMKITTRVPLAAMALVDTLAVPPGWERAVVFNLAVEIAPEFELEVSPRVVKTAQDGLARIKRASIKPARTSSELMQLVGAHRPNIVSDLP